MNKKLTAFCIFLAALTAGCGVNGRWESVSLKPEIARDKFRLTGSPSEGLGFRKTIITFYEDSTYYAETFYGPNLQTSTGQWERDNKILTIVDEMGKPHTYDLNLDDWDNSMRLTRRIEGTEVILELRRLPLEKE